MTANTGCHLLRVDLTTGKTEEEMLPERDVEMLIGGRSLGALILYKEIPAGTPPLGENNVLIFSTGPLAGTAAPGSARYCVHTKSPLTGLYLYAISGGYFGPELRRTGHDILVIKGRAEKPIYLIVSDGSIQIKDASHLWGMPADLTQEFIKDEIHDGKARITCIGPAGENQVLYASIMGERRAAGRGGAGAVMGSKNLKAIVVRGTREVQVADPVRLRKAVRAAVNIIGASPVLQKMVKHGSPTFINDINDHGILPCRNWQEAETEWAKRLYTDVFEHFIVKHMHCSPPCSIRCSKLTLVRSGPYAGAVTEGPEYETLYSLGACCGITDMAAIIEADSLCDRYGLDTISFGVSLAFAMECYEKEIISKSDTGGKELRFGDATLLAGLIRDTAFKQGFGEILAEGTRRMSQRFGKGSEAFAMHTKGMELGGYDPRGAKSGALIFACGPRGGCHHAEGYTWMAEMYNPEPKARFSIEGKGALVKKAKERRIICDSSIVCTFSGILGYGDVELAGMLSGATGLDLTEADMPVIGERGSNIERAFNVREGLRRNWDTLPARLLQESVPAGSTRGETVELEPLLDDYYSVCGWDLKTGIPGQDRLNELGLQEFAEEMRGLE